MAAFYSHGLISKASLLQAISWTDNGNRLTASKIKYINTKTNPKTNWTYREEQRTNGPRAECEAHLAAQLRISIFCDESCKPSALNQVRLT